MPSVAGDESTLNIRKSTKGLESSGSADYVILDLQEEGMDRKPSMGNGGSSAYNGEDVKASRQKKAGKTCEPFDTSEREEMEKLLGELRGHLGMQVISPVCIANSLRFSSIPFSILGRRRYVQQFPVQRR
jgi:hypothetical protein